jgi:hypothetical protein
MNEPGIGRVLVASLHQSIADILPTRLEFYENWLSPVGFREGNIGLAPLYAVLSFLRQEGDTYQTIMTRSGQYAADWTVEAMTPLERATVHAAPQWVRRRVVLRLARRMVRNTYQGGRAVSRLRRGVAQVEIRNSLFCVVRGGPSARPLCGYYAAAFARLLYLFHLHVETEILACRGTGESSYLVKVAFAKSQPDDGDRDALD